MGNTKTKNQQNRGFNSYTEPDTTQPTFSIIDGLPEVNAMPSVLDNAEELDNDVHA